MKIKITDISGQGFGFTKIDKQKIFVPYSAPGDELEIEIKSENKKFVKGEIKEILKESPCRAKPECKYFGQCGGCLLQHVNEETYYNLKEKFIKTAISYAGYEVPQKIEILKTGYNSRRRCVFKINSNNKLCFNKKESKELIEIDNCPVLENYLNELIAPLNDKLSKNLNIAKEITLTKTGNEVLISPYIETKYSTENPQIKLGEYLIDLPEEVFLQATVKGQNYIVEEILKNINKDEKVLDLYAGIGTYTFSIVDKVESIKAVEGVRAMTKAMDKNLSKHSLEDKIVTQKRDLYESPILWDELNKYDSIIINPPRNGASPQCREITKSEVKKVIMVSCDPSSFSVDAGILREGGYELKSVIGVDQFYMTPIVEVVAIFEK